MSDLAPVQAEAVTAWADEADVVVVGFGAAGASAAYEAANRWTKTGWVTVLALSLVIGQALSLFSFIGLAALVATIVYFVDVRPALQRLS